MHLPSLSAVKCNTIHKELYSGLLGKHSIKMKAWVDIQRKMLELSYILLKKNTQYNANYQQEKEAVIITNSLRNKHKAVVNYKFKKKLNFCLGT